MTDLFDQPACATCRYSVGTDGGLFCELKEQEAVAVCVDWMREPGSDDV